MPRRTRALPEPMRDKNGIRIYCVDVMDGLRGLPDESVHCAVTSPPYWGLRDYGVDGQVGLEKTPEEYVKRMVGIFREVRRVLRGDGTFWLNIGDSYASGGCGARDAERWPKQSRNDHRVEHSHKAAAAGLKHKDLVGIPWRLAFALQADGWYLRSDIIWAKPNPMPESVTDRPTKSHEYVFLLTKRGKYFWDQEAVKEASTSDRSGNYFGSKAQEGTKRQDVGRECQTIWGRRNIRTVWTIPTQPNPEAHFATFPERLPERCIKAGTSEIGCCPECGAPWVRVVARTPMVIDRSERTHPKGQTRSSGTMVSPASSITIGWEASCACGLDPIPATVLDPFMGSGTTLFVAKMLGRHAIGFDLSEKYCSIAVSRCMKRSRRGISRHKRLRKSRR